MRLGSVVIGMLFVLGLALAAEAGSIADRDGDLVPDAFDNCVEDANGPNQGLINQLDTNADGYGNWCDADYNNDGRVDGADFGIFVSFFGSGDLTADLTGNGLFDGGDFGRFIVLFNQPTGPSGLPCAGTIPCVP